MRLVMLGAPGSGKRTQASQLAKKYGLTTLTSTELVKTAMSEESEQGQQLRLLQEAGQGVTDDVILGLLQRRLLQPDVKHGFILDGFPRNLLQALTLDEMLTEIGQPIDFVILIHIETDTLMERLVGRRTCRTCGATYNIYTHPTVVEDVCDACGGRLHRRYDDNEETVSNRLHVYDHLTSQLLSHYGKQEKVLRVDGDGEVDEVFVRVCEAIDHALTRPREVPAPVPAESAVTEQPALPDNTPDREVVDTPAVPTAPEDQGLKSADKTQKSKTKAKQKAPIPEAAKGSKGKSAATPPKKAVPKPAVGQRTHAQPPKAAAKATTKGAQVPPAKAAAAGAPVKASPAKGAKKPAVVSQGKAQTAKPTVKQRAGKTSPGKAQPQVKQAGAKKSAPVKAKAPAAKKAIPKTPAKSAATKHAAVKKATVKKATVKKAAVKKAPPVKKANAKAPTVKKATTGIKKKQPAVKVSAKPAKSTKPTKKKAAPAKQHQKGGGKAAVKTVKKTEKTTKPTVKKTAKQVAKKTTGRSRR